MDAASKNYFNFGIGVNMTSSDQLGSELPIYSFIDPGGSAASFLPLAASRYFGTRDYMVIRRF